MPYVSYDGARLHHEVIGSGPPLVLHPGFIACAEDWVDEGLCRRA